MSFREIVSRRRLHTTTLFADMLVVAGVVPLNAFIQWKAKSSTAAA